MSKGAGITCTKARSEPLEWYGIAECAAASAPFHGARRQQLRQRSTEPAGRETGEQHGADQGPIDGKRPGRKILQDAEQTPDRDKGRKARDDEPDAEHRPAMGIEPG